MPLLLLPGIVLVGGPEGVHGAVRAGRGGVERVESGGLGCNSIDIFFGPESGPEPDLSPVWGFETCLNL